MTTNINSVRIISRDACIYCKKAKEFCAEKKIPYVEEMMDPDQDDYFQKRDVLVEKTNQKTFPFIFMGDHFIGGYTQLVEAYNDLTLHNLGIASDTDF